MVSADASFAWRQPHRLKVWVAEPFCGGSHKYFLEGLERYSEHEVVLLTLPGRNWKWRMHGGALSLAEQARDRVAAAGGAPDVLFVTDMLDLPVFLTAAGPGLAGVPALIYFHENQLTYPLPPDTPRDLGYGMKNITSALAARSVLFNSRYHRDEFLTGVKELLAAMPDRIPEWVVPALEAKAGVLPVGCDLRRLDAFRESGRADAAAGRWGDPAAGPLLLWNQRWEYDKAPEALLAAALALKDRDVPFRLALAGADHGERPEELGPFKERLGETVVQWGRVPGVEDYASLLWAADVVVSTAIHEFFGVSVVEAVYCGCRPVLPARLSYPEIIPREAHEQVLYREGGLVEALQCALESPGDWSEDWQRTWVARYDWTALGPRYDEEIRRCRRAGRRGS